MSRWFFLAALFFSVRVALAGPQATPPPRPLDPVEAAKQGRALVDEILSQAPERGFTNAGILTIREANGGQKSVPVRFEMRTGPNQWLGIYAADWTNRIEKLTILHVAGQSNVCFYRTNSARNDNPVVPVFGGEVPVLGHLFRSNEVSGAELAKAFAGSDFWLADLSLDFFQWPAQRILKSEPRRTRACKVLESINPQPAPGTYSRVVSWIDIESHGIVHAEAYDLQNNLLKEFDAKSFTKVNGAWQLKQMQMENAQTGSRTVIEFSFDDK